MMKTYGIVLFFSTQAAMKAERLAQQEHFQARIIPTPEKIHASCGFFFYITLEEEAAIRELFTAEQVAYENFYHVKRDGLAVTYELVGG